MKERSKLFQLKRVKRDLNVKKKSQELQELYWNYACVYTSRLFGSYYWGFRQELRNSVQKTSWWEREPKSTSLVYWLGETLRRVSVNSFLSWLCVLYMCGHIITTKTFLPPMWLTIVMLANSLIVILRSFIHRKHLLELCCKIVDSPDEFVNIVEKTSDSIDYYYHQVKKALRHVLKARREAENVDQAIEKLDDVISKAKIHLRFFASMNELYTAGALRCTLSNEQERRVMASMPRVLKASKLTAKANEIVERVRSLEKEQQNANFIERQVSLITDLQTIKENLAL